MTKEIPILFSTPMVQAILAGRKTMTRRVVKPQPAHETDISFMRNEPLNWTGDWHPWKWETEEGESIAKSCPYGKPGDLLYVRESWVWEGETSWQDISRIGTFWYKADDDGEGFSPARWKPSIHMPKVAARIWLEVTNVRVELLHDISNEDVVSEGVDWKDYSFQKTICREWGIENTSSYSAAFFMLWWKINGLESLKSNPWVWVIEFKVISKTGKP